MTDDEGDVLFARDLIRETQCLACGKVVPSSFGSFTQTIPLY
jgi:hypothetical protein